MIADILIAWLPLVIILSVAITSIYFVVKMVKRIDRALPDRDRKI